MWKSKLRMIRCSRVTCVSTSTEISFALEDDMIAHLSLHLHILRSYHDYQIGTCSDTKKEGPTNFADNPKEPMQLIRIDHSIAA